MGVMETVVKKWTERKERLGMILEMKMMTKNLIHPPTGDAAGQQEAEEAAVVAARAMMTGQALQGEGADDVEGMAVMTGAAGGGDIHTDTDMEEDDVVGTAGQAMTALTMIPIITAHAGAPLHNRE